MSKNILKKSLTWRQKKWVYLFIFFFVYSRSLILRCLTTRKVFSRSRDWGWRLISNAQTRFGLQSLQQNANTRIYIMPVFFSKNNFLHCCILLFFFFIEIQHDMKSIILSILATTHWNCFYFLYYFNDFREKTEIPLKHAMLVGKRELKTSQPLFVNIALFCGLLKTTAIWHGFRPILQNVQAHLTTCVKSTTIMLAFNTRTLVFVLEAGRTFVKKLINLNLSDISRENSRIASLSAYLRLSGKHCERVGWVISWKNVCGAYLCRLNS